MFKITYTFVLEPGGKEKLKKKEEIKLLHAEGKSDFFQR